MNSAVFAFVSKDVVTSVALAFLSKDAVTSAVFAFVPIKCATVGLKVASAPRASLNSFSAFTASSAPSMVLANLLSMTVLVWVVAVVA